jgi:hypothetical protein
MLPQINRCLVLFVKGSGLADWAGLDAKQSVGRAEPKYRSAKHHDADGHDRELPSTPGREVRGKRRQKWRSQQDGPEDKANCTI